MTRQDFIVIADIIKSLPKSVRPSMTRRFSARLKEAYPNFDPITFADYVNKD